MLLTITTTHQPARDIGFLLHKNPDNVQSFELSYGTAHIYYPEATDQRCTMAMQLEVDPIGLIRGKKGRFDHSFSLKQYVNDRPYTASSLMSTTISKILGTALSGICKHRPELVHQAIPLQARLSVVPSRSGKKFPEDLFQPLGYTVEAVQHPLDVQFPQWGEGKYFTVTVANTITLKELLTHLYVLIPVLDGEKHYWVGDVEVEKLLAKGAGWLETHPLKDVIAFRYLKKRKHLTTNALKRLLEVDGPQEEVEEKPTETEKVIEEKLYLNDQRLNEVFEIFKNDGCARVIDLGCGEGKLLRHFLKDRQFTEIVGIDISYRALERAQAHLDRLPPTDQDRIKLLQGSLTYRDNRLMGYDGVAVVEVIEHLDPERLAAFERVLFECTAPRLIVLTTPNFEYNVKFEGPAKGAFRHSDHRFEWTRAQFQEWALKTAAQYGYAVEFKTVGTCDETVGAPTQMGVFKR